jgi:hypothetical protein
VHALEATGAPPMTRFASYSRQALECIVASQFGSKKVLKIAAQLQIAGPPGGQNHQSAD